MTYVQMRNQARRDAEVLATYATMLGRLEEPIDGVDWNRLRARMYSLHVTR